MDKTDKKTRSEIIEDNYFYATQLYFMGIKEYIESTKNSRDNKGLTLGTQLQERLEEILMEPHTRKIKEMKGRLKKADKEYERKIHYMILELITRYE